ncbi:2OG-Fe(II) oxygenase family protein [Xenorhabdus griffiniae]|uniref:2OG-Fe(II) oxygenase family protein n=1 Tax=Xenorhabdus griffiniae TaxID=351672 RepID=UPI0023592087|nr:2OG-Fe(II) oxygenase family protein [Xenorhabdus griffiniae]MDC9607175.1 2OG-Fe(II) oxygenase family protein [Xenorhabdus griffiniae]
MKLEKYIPECASFIDGNLHLKSKESLIKALKDGFFSLKIPEYFDLKPGIKISKNFYIDKNSTAIKQFDGYKGYKKEKDIYFNHENYQIENILIDKDKREKLFPKELNELCDKMHGIGKNILCEVLSFVGVNNSLWKKITDDATNGGGIKWFTANHYRSNLNLDGAPAHKDTGFITVLYCDKPGLEAYIDGKWLDVDICNKSFLINFCGALELLTKNMEIPVNAVLHRVRKHEKKTHEEDRFSFAAFINPASYKYLYQVDNNGSFANEIILCKDFLLEFNKKTWSDRYSDFGILKK